MHFHYRILIIGVACLSTCLQVHAAPQGEGTVKLTMRLANATIAVRATNIPAQVIIENTTKGPIKCHFNSSLLVGADFKSVEFVVPTTGKVRTRPRAFPPSIELQLITLEPGQKYVGDVDLAQFIEVTDVGEHEVGLKANLGYDRKAEEMAGSTTITMSGQTAIRLDVRDSRDRHE